MHHHSQAHSAHDTLLLLRVQHCECAQTGPASSTGRSGFDSLQGFVIMKLFFLLFFSLLLFLFSFFFCFRVFFVVFSTGKGRKASETTQIMSHM